MANVAGTSLDKSRNQLSSLTVKHPVTKPFYSSSYSRMNWALQYPGMNQRWNHMGGNLECFSTYMIVLKISLQTPMPCMPQQTLLKSSINIFTISTACCVAWIVQSGELINAPDPFGAVFVPKLWAVSTMQQAHLWPTCETLTNFTKAERHWTKFAAWLSRNRSISTVRDRPSDKDMNNYININVRACTRPLTLS